MASATRPFDEHTLARLSSALGARELDFQIGFFELARARNPDDVEALETLGMAYTQRGLYAQGLEVDRRLAELRPKNPRVHYNLACSYALVGDVDLAIASLERAIELGYDDVEHLERDRDLDPIRHDRRFQELVRKIA
jgi:tetratricopeptide (TPR) repeat protein